MMRRMKRRTVLKSISAGALLPAANLIASGKETLGATLDASLVYELRVYHCFEGKLPDLLKRFREHTMKIFEKHGMKNIAYWLPMDDPQKSNTLIYIIAHPSREAAAANWKAFGADPEWQAVQKASEANGKIVEKVDSTFMTLTDFSYTSQ
jgi:NIPSNAP